MISHFLGYSSVVLFLYCLFYKKINKYFGKIKLSRLLKFHYVIGIIGFIFAIVHSALSIIDFHITFGTIGLILYLFVLISGIVIARLKGKNRKNAIYVHIALSIFTLIFIFFHISEHLILG